MADHSCTGIVYLITHLATGKRYVGVTTQSLSARWRQHCYARWRGTYPYPGSLHAAMCEHGADAFTMEVIDTTNAITELYAKERGWIATLHTSTPEGFNLAPGKAKGIKVFDWL